MNTRRLSIVPTAALVKEVQGKGAVVVCKGGAWPGARIYFSDPNNQPFTGADSEPLINGEAYMGPEGSFERFWISFPATIATAPENLELVVLDCASPVVVLNGTRGRGPRIHSVAGGTGGVIQVSDGLVVLYQDNVPGATSPFTNTTTSGYMPRGTIGGGIGATGPFVAALWERIDPSGNSWVEMGRFTVDTADRAGNFSVDFNVGAQNSWRTTGTFVKNGPLALPWPPCGLRLSLENTPGPGAVNYAFLLYERLEAG